MCDKTMCNYCGERTSVINSLKILRIITKSKNISRANFIVVTSENLYVRIIKLLVNSCLSLWWWK